MHPDTLTNYVAEKVRYESLLSIDCLIEVWICTDFNEKRLRALREGVCVCVRARTRVH